MALLKTPDGLALVEHVIRELTPVFPPGSSVRATAHEKFGLTVEGEGPGRTHTSAFVFIGTWLPLMPRTALARINAQSATEIVAEALGESDEPDGWPYQGCKVKTAREGDVIQVWFHDGQGGRKMHAFELPLAECLGEAAS